MTHRLTNWLSHIKPSCSNCSDGGDIEDELESDFDGPFSELGIDLTNNTYNMSDALMASLPAFKQETANEPTGRHHHQQQQQRHSYQTRNKRRSQCSSNDSSRSSYCPGSSPGPSAGRTGSGGRLLTLAPADPDSSHDWINLVSSLGNLDSAASQSTFQYVLLAATSPATKLNEETQTYLNQGQSYEIKMKRLGQLTDEPQLYRSVVRVVFHERRLQYMEKEHLEVWRQTRPGERIIDIDIPLSYGLMDLKIDTQQVNSLECMWDARREAAIFVRIHCISTEFTARKHGGEKGVPFRLQIETYDSRREPTYSGLLHCASCQIKVFKPKGADRKHKTDREKLDKRTDADKEKYQPSYESTVLTDIPTEQVQCYLEQLERPRNDSLDMKPVLRSGGSHGLPCQNKRNMPYSPASSMTSSCSITTGSSPSSLLPLRTHTPGLELSCTPVSVAGTTAAVQMESQMEGQVQYMEQMYVSDETGRQVGGHLTETRRHASCSGLMQSTMASPAAVVDGLQYGNNSCGGGGGDPVMGLASLQQESNPGLLRTRSSECMAAGGPRIQQQQQQQQGLVVDRQLIGCSTGCSVVGGSCDADSSTCFNRLSGDHSSVDCVTSNSLPDELIALSPSASSAQVVNWLTCHRFTNHIPTFQHFAGSDLLRLSREDLIQICGTADGIRLNNALHIKNILPQLTIYIRRDPSWFNDAACRLQQLSRTASCNLDSVVSVSPRSISPDDFHNNNNNNNNFSSSCCSAPNSIHHHQQQQLVSCCWSNSSKSQTTRSINNNNEDNSQSFETFTTELNASSSNSSNKLSTVITSAPFSPSMFTQSSEVFTLSATSLLEEQEEGCQDQAVEQLSGEVEGIGRDAGYRKLGDDSECNTRCCTPQQQYQHPATMNQASSSTVTVVVAAVPANNTVVSPSLKRALEAIGETDVENDDGTAEKRHRGAEPEQLKQVEVYDAIFLDKLTRHKLVEQLSEVLGVSHTQFHTVYTRGPIGINIDITDNVVENIKDHSKFALEVERDVVHPNAMNVLLRQQTH